MKAIMTFAEIWDRWVKRFQLDALRKKRREPELHPAQSLEDALRIEKDVARGLK